MKSKFKLLCLSIMTLAAAAGCGGSKESVSSGTSTSEGPKGYATLSEAINNTSTFGITAESRLEDGWYFEVVLDNLFYYSPSDVGYIILDEDPEFFHSFSQSMIDGEDYISYELKVHGRNGIASDFNKTFTGGTYLGFMGIMKKYQDDFFKVDENTYSSSVASIGDDLEVYFQSRSLTYSNYYEVDINEEGRLDTFRVYEVDGNYKTETMEFLIDDLELNNYKPYLRWNQAGRVKDVRLFDIKYGYEKNNKYISVYEDETMEIEGVVTSIDAKGNYYIAREDNSNGNIGIRVTPISADRIPKLYQTVKVTGKIKTQDFMPYVDEAQYAISGAEAKYLPIFDEETVVDNYGGGAYAYQLFAQAPYFADSVYSGFAYVLSAPLVSVEGEDTVITLACPNATSLFLFNMRLVIPKEVEKATRDSLLMTINSYGKYGNNGVELSIQNVLVRFDNSYDYRVVLEITSQTTISKRLSPQEKIQSVLGLADFPIPAVTGGSCFRFGGSTGLFIETYYGKDTTDTLGVYLNATSVEMKTIEAYISDIEDYGFTKIEEQLDIYTGRHQIFTYGNIVLDMLVSPGMSENYVYYIWIYEGDVLRYLSIEDRLTTSIGSWFDVDDFAKLTGTFDADYTYYELTNFAGRDFDVDDPLRCITLDLTSDRFAELRSLYAAAGFSQSRNSEGRIATYVTRGSAHYIYEKSTGVGNEKIYIDMAMYPTTDYTYSGHSNFTDRIEIMIYKAEQPLTTIYTDSMVEFSNEIVEKYGEAARLYADLPANSRVELVKGNGKFTEYGYNYNDEAFVYGDSLDEIESAIVAGLTFSGYTRAFKNNRSDVYVKDVTDPLAAYSTYCYIFIMKETTRGYVRVGNSLGGVDF